MKPEFTREELMTPVRYQEGMQLGLGCGTAMAFGFAAPFTAYGYWAFSDPATSLSALVFGGAAFVIIMSMAYISSRQIKYIAFDPIEQAITYPNGVQVPFSEIEEPWVHEHQVPAHFSDGSPGRIETVCSLILNRRGRILQLHGRSRESLEKIGRLLVAMKQEAENRDAENATTVVASILDSAPRASENATSSDRPTDGRSSGRTT